jgi:hypothetical protein
MEKNKTKQDKITTSDRLTSCSERDDVRKQRRQRFPMYSESFFAILRPISVVIMANPENNTGHQRFRKTSHRIFHFMFPISRSILLSTSDQMKEAQRSNERQRTGQRKEECKPFSFQILFFSNSSGTILCEGNMMGSMVS